MLNEQKLDEVLLDLGHDDFNRGTGYLREAVRMYRPGMSLTKELYPGIAAAHGSNPARVERCMRHSMDKAWGRSDWGAQGRYFGGSIDPDRGRPMLGEYIARLSRICHED